MALSPSKLLLRRGVIALLDSLGIWTPSSFTLGRFLVVGAIGYLVNQLHLRFAQFNTASFGSPIISTATLNVLTPHFGINYLAANSIGIGLGVTWNWLWNTRFIWRRKKAQILRLRGKSGWAFSPVRSRPGKHRPIVEGDERPVKDTNHRDSTAEPVNAEWCLHKKHRFSQHL